MKIMPILKQIIQIVKLINKIVKIIKVKEEINLSDLRKVITKGLENSLDNLS